MESVKELRGIEENVLLVVQEIGDDVTRCFIIADGERGGEYIRSIKRGGERGAI